MHGEKQSIGTTLNQLQGISMAQMRHIVTSDFQKYIARIDFAIGRRIRNNLANYINMSLFIFNQRACFLLFSSRKFSKFLPCLSLQLPWTCFLVLADLWICICRHSSRLTIVALSRSFSRIGIYSRWSMLTVHCTPIHPVVGIPMKRSRLIG